MLLEYQHLKSLTMFNEDWFEGWAQYLLSDSTYSINIHTLIEYLEKLESESGQTKQLHSINIRNVIECVFLISLVSVHF